MKHPTAASLKGLLFGVKVSVYLIYLTLILPNHSHITVLSVCKYLFPTRLLALFTVCMFTVTNLKAETDDNTVIVFWVCNNSLYCLQSRFLTVFRGERIKARYL